MRFRVGVLDVAAAAIVIIVIVLPPRTPKVTAADPELREATVQAIGEHQARLMIDGGDGAAAEDLAELLSQAGYSDWALRVAGEASRNTDAPLLWRSLRAVSAAHADRIEIDKALAWGRQALGACRASTAACPAHEEVRLALYVEQLEAGVRSGIDPQVDPQAFRDAIGRAGIRRIWLKPPPVQ